MTKETQKTIILRCLKVFHFLATVALFVLSWRAGIRENEIVFAERYNYFVYLFFAFIFLLFLRIYNAYAVEFNTVPDLALSLCLSSAICICAVYFSVIIVWQRYLPPKYFLLLIAGTFPLNFLWAALSHKIYARIAGRIPAVFFYRKRSDFKFLYEINGFEKKYDLLTSMEDPQSSEDAISAIGDAEAVFISGIDCDVRNEIVKYCVEYDINIFVAPRIGDVFMMCGTYMNAFPVPTMHIRTAVYPEYLILKRISDVILSAAAILITGPLMLLTALLIHCYDGGPAIYKQVRLTTHGKKFKICKFRSMCVAAESDGVARLSVGESDPRITPIGKVIRKIRLDELPQLFNILKGDMSFVGPRPERPEIAAQYEAAVPEFKLRLRVKAGLTGYAQVYGKYNSDPHDKLEMDLIYISKMSPALDLRLMLATVRTLFLRESTQGIGADKITALSDEDDKATV